MGRKPVFQNNLEKGCFFIVLMYIWNLQTWSYMMLERTLSLLIFKLTLACYIFEPNPIQLNQAIAWPSQSVIKLPPAGPSTSSAIKHRILNKKVPFKRQWKLLRTWSVLMDLYRLHAFSEPYPNLHVLLIVWRLQHFSSPLLCAKKLQKYENSSHRGMFKETSKPETNTMFLRSVSHPLGHDFGFTILKRSYVKAYPLF